MTDVLEFYHELALRTSIIAAMDADLTTVVPLWGEVRKMDWDIG